MTLVVATLEALLAHNARVVTHLTGAAFPNNVANGERAHTDSLWSRSSQALKGRL